MRVFNQTTVILVLGLSVLLSACASSTKLPCTTTDWYELGRQQGASGTEKNAPRTIASSCKAEGEQLDAQALFESGHSLGLSEYCSEKNGYQLAQMSHEYRKGTCPQLLEDAFLRGYKSGLEAIQISRDRKTIKNKIQRIEGSLLKSNMHFARRGLLNAERFTLVEESNRLARLFARYQNDDVTASTDSAFFVK
ncbi:MAG: DUF2799 domain-containing protein [Bdellovibrionota bacterium]